MNKKKNEGIVDGFIFYRSYFEAIETLSIKNKLIAYEAITRYALDGEEPASLPKRVLSIFKVAIRNLEANRRKYLKKLEKEALTNPNGTIPIFENEVILPPKEVPIVIKDNSQFDDCNDDNEFIP